MAVPSAAQPHPKDRRTTDYTDKQCPVSAYPCYPCNPWFESLQLCVRREPSNLFGHLEAFPVLPGQQLVGLLVIHDALGLGVDHQLAAQAVLESVEAHGVVLGEVLLHACERFVSFLVVAE